MSFIWVRGILYPPKIFPRTPIFFSAPLSKIVGVLALINLVTYTDPITGQRIPIETRAYKESNDATIMDLKDFDSIVWDI